MDAGNWANYGGRARTTRQHLPRIHEQQQTDDPQTHDDETHLDLELQDQGERERQGEPTSAAGERREKGGEIKIQRWYSSESP